MMIIMNNSDLFNSTGAQQSPTVGVARMGPNSKEMRAYKNSLPPQNRFQQEVLIGTLLGDASLERRNKNLAVKFQQSEKHKLYLEYLQGLFDGYVLSPPHRQVRDPHPKTGEVYVSYGAQTLSHPEFDFQKEIFTGLKDGRVVKAVKASIAPFITPVSLAFWWQDDGGKSDYNVGSQNQGLTFNTHAFTEAEIAQLIELLDVNLGIKSWSSSNKDGLVIQTYHKDYVKILAMMDPYITPSMRYKLPLFDDIV